MIARGGKGGTSLPHGAYYPQPEPPSASVRGYFPHSLVVYHKFLPNARDFCNFSPWTPCLSQTSIVRKEAIHAYESSPSPSLASPGADRSGGGSAQRAIGGGRRCSAPDRPPPSDPSSPPRSVLATPESSPAPLGAFPPPKGSHGRGSGGHAPCLRGIRPLV